MHMVDAPETESQTIALHVEDLSVSRRRVDGDTVRLAIVTGETGHAIDEKLVEERIEVSRVPIGRPVESAPPDRQEGDTTIISVMEEVLVVKRQLVVKEEVRIKRIRVETHHQETVMVRDQKAELSRIHAMSAAEEDPQSSGLGPR